MPRCLNCKQKFEPKRFLQKHCESADCEKSAQQYLDDKIAKALKTVKQKKKQDWNKEKIEIKEKLKSLSDYERDAKKSFQKWIRLRDSKLPCISCGNLKTDDWAGGHYFPAGIYSGLMFDERNCHKQCNTHCNKYLSGNLIEYRKGLIKRYGEEFVVKLESLSDEKRNYKYTKQELIAKKLQYDIKIKEFKL